MCFGSVILSGALAIASIFVLLIVRSLSCNPRLLVKSVTYFIHDFNWPTLVVITSEVIFEVIFEVTMLERSYTYEFGVFIGRFI